ncbi:hypothetical protein SHIRM173S_00525 [Streptomyces hirsutus]
MTTLLVIAKEPRPGRVKTRLTPPFTPGQAAELAEAALADTLHAVAATPASRRVLVLDGAPGPWLPPGFDVVPQCAGGLDERLADAFARCDGPALLIGMDTPQVTPELLTVDFTDCDAHFGPAEDGGFWALGLARPDPALLRGVPMLDPGDGSGPTGPALLPACGCATCRPCATSTPLPTPTPSPPWPRTAASPHGWPGARWSRGRMRGRSREANHRRSRGSTADRPRSRDPGRTLHRTAGRAPTGPLTRRGTESAHGRTSMSTPHPDEHPVPRRPQSAARSVAAGGPASSPCAAAAAAAPAAVTAAVLVGGDQQPGGEVPVRRQPRC